MAGLTSKQRAFAKGVASGLPPASAARAAGYAEKSPHALQVQASRLTKHPEVQAAAHAEREKLISQTAHRALACLASIIDNEAAQPAARVQASRWVLEAAGHGLEAAKLLHRIGEGDERAVSQLSAADLEALVVMAADKVRFERGQVIDAETGETV
jgi:hypothetical protein